MDASTHFNDLTNLVASPRNAMVNIHSGPEAAQPSHFGLTQHDHTDPAHSATYDTSSQDTLMKHGATDLNVFNASHLSGDTVSVNCQSKQLEDNRQPHEGDAHPTAPQSAGLAQAFGIDVSSRSNSGQRSVQGSSDVHDFFRSPVHSSGSQATVQAQTSPDASTPSSHAIYDQVHPAPVQLKTEPTVELHQVRSYPSSPPSRSQMLPQSDHRSFEGGVRAAEGRHVPSHRPSHSLGQAGAFMSGVSNRDMLVHSHVSAPVSPSEGLSAGPFPALFHYPGPGHELGLNIAEHSQAFHHSGYQVAVRNFSRSCAPSVRSTSPTASMASTSMTSISPLGSARQNPDGSFTSQETSFDSLSNAASGSFSRASSASEDIFSYDTGSFGLAASLRMSKQKKKLRNIDRKMICDYAEDNPTAKQDAIAHQFGIERSTVSKILKQKDKWLAIDPRSDAARIAKHRAVKFPAIEDRLTSWVAEMRAQGKPIRDSAIRQKALSIASEIGLGEDKFKASGGWIEKFRERNGIAKPSAEAANNNPDATEPTRESTPSPGRGAVPLAPRLAPPTDATSMSPIDAPSASAGASAQSQPVRRQPARGGKAKGTPQKRARDEEETQAILGMSPLSQDMARMQFHNVGSSTMVPDAVFFRPDFYDGHPATPQSMQNCNILYNVHGVPGQPHSVEDDDHEHKRRRALQDFQGSQAAMGLGPPIEFQFPPSQVATPGSSSQMDMSGQLPQALAQADISPQNGSPRRSRTVSKPGDGSSRGRARRGKGRLSNANHAPQTPSPLSMSPADENGESSLHSMNAADAEQFTAATLERIRALHNSGDKSSIVSAEQAQQSLKLVLRFLSEQPSGFVPPNHFVVFGHLQANIEQKIKDQLRDSPAAEAPGSQASPHSDSLNGEGMNTTAGEQ